MWVESMRILEVTIGSNLNMDQHLDNVLTSASLWAFDPSGHMDSQKKSSTKWLVQLHWQARCVPCLHDEWGMQVWNTKAK